jgi:hypothetical protein
MHCNFIYKCKIFIIEVKILILTLNDVVDFKNDVSKFYSSDIHFHDGCGGQYFSLDEKNEDLKEYIIKYFSQKNLKAVFNGDLQFTVQTGE